MEFTDINKNGQFEFHNLFLPDSIPVHFTFYKKKNLDEVNFKYSTKIKTENDVFNHSFIPNLKDEPINTIVDRISPAISENRATKLKEVVASKSTLKHKDELGGLTYNKNMQKAYKVKSSDLGRTVLSYLKANGFAESNRFPFQTSNDQASGKPVDNLILQVDASARTTGSTLTKRTMVYLDNMPVMEHERLWFLFMEDLEEIYTDRRPNIIEGSIGVVKLYSKSQKGTRKNINSITTEDALLVNDANYKDLNFIYWHNNIESSANGIVNFDIPNTASKKVKLVIEGISNDGQLISTSKIVNLN
jgi:hypothetical protein